MSFGVGLSKSAPDLAINPDTYYLVHYQYGTSGFVVEDALSKLSQSLIGLNGGAQVGHNWRVAPALILGIEAEFGYMGLHNTASNAIPYCANCPSSQSATVKTDFLLSVRPRIGIVVDQWLIFATSGFAGTVLETNYVFTGSRESAILNTTRRHLMAGWTAGGGVEWALPRSRWTAKAEYLHIDFGTAYEAARLSDIGDGHPVNSNRAVFNYENRLTTNIVRIGFNYKM